MDIKIYVDKLVKAGKPENVATETITDAIAMLKERHGDEATDEFITKRLNLVFAEDKSGDSFRLTILAFDRGFDVNVKVRETCQTMLDTNYERAMKEGYAKEVVDPNTGETRIILTDYREMLEFSGKESKNYNFGKELKYDIKREVVGLTDEGELVRASVFASDPPKLGYDYMVSGKVTERGYFGNKRGIRELDQANVHDLWGRTLKGCSTSELAIALVDAPTLEDWKVFVTYGIVKKSYATSNDSIMVVLTDDNVSEGIVGFSASTRDPIENRQFDGVKAVCEGLYEGSEAIVIAKARTKPDGSFTMSIIGAIQPYDAEEQNITQNELARMIMV